MFADIFLSKYHEEAFNGITDKLKEVNPADLEQNHIIITPDRHTLSLEKLIYSSLGGRGSFNISVLTLKRLCAKISDGRHISANGAVMIVNKAVNDCLPRLKCFKNSVKYFGFSQSVYKEICRLKNSFITYTDLLNASKNASGEFALRLHDIALIYQRYNALTEGRYIDSSAHLHIISEKAESSNLIKNSCFYFAGFDQITKAEGKCFLSILKHSKYCCFAACTEGELHNALKTDFKQQNIFYNEHIIKDFRGNRQDYIYNNIESANGEKYSGNEQNIKLFACSDILKETENAAQQIILLIKQKKLRLKDISVILPNAEDYIYSLDKVFKGYNLPYYLAESVKLSSEPLFKAVYNLLSAAADNCSAENVIAFVKSAFFGEEEYSLSVFENYCKKYGIDRSRFLQPFTLQDGEDDLAAAESVRAKFAGFIKMTASSGACNYFTQAVRNIIEKFYINGNQNLIQYGYMDEAAFRAQAKQKLYKLLEEIDEFAAKENITLKQFKEMLFAGAQSQKLSIIPVSADVIMCGGIDSAKYSSAKALFILGAAEGKFPSVNYTPYILTHGDLKKHTLLASAEGDLSLQLKQSHQKIKKLLCSVGDIFISYHTSGEEGKDLAPSSYYLKILKMFDKNAQNGLSYQLKKQAEGFNFNRQQIENAGQLYFKSNKTSVSAIETYFNCPRKFLFRYGYRAMPAKEAGLKSLDKGIFLHEVVELFMKKYIKGGKVLPLAEQCYNIVIKNEVYKRFMAEVSARAAFGKLKEEIFRVCAALAKITDNSDFVPMYFEASFDENGEFPLIKLNIQPRQMYLRGKIDRIDVYNNSDKKYARIIDYKSGYAAYSEKALYFGEKIQLFIYIKALSDNGFIPAGAYYFPIHDKCLVKEEKPYKLLGVTVADINILNASDKNLLPSAQSDIIDVKIAEDENGFKENKNLILQKTLESFIVYAQKLTVTAINEILQGEVQITPVKQACGYCEYKDVCSVNISHAAVRETSLYGAKNIILEAAYE